MGLGFVATVRDPISLDPLQVYGSCANLGVTYALIINFPTYKEFPTFSPSTYLHNCHVSLVMGAIDKIDMFYLITLFGYVMWGRDSMMVFGKESKVWPLSGHSLVHLTKVEIILIF